MLALRDRPFERIARAMDRPLPSLATFQSAIWDMLRREPYRRPRMAEVAARLGMTDVQLRRYLKRHNASRMRDVIAWSCLTYAADLILDGTKVEAAALAAGFRNRTNFNHQFRDYLGCQPANWRRRGVGFDSHRR
jgi:AraC-like DNA-binding protein